MVAMTMAVGSLLAAGVLLMLKLKPEPDQPLAASEKNDASLKGARAIP
jgi:hypothetical protein